MHDTRKKPSFRSAFASAAGGFLSSSAVAPLQSPSGNGHVTNKSSGDGAPASAEAGSSR